MSFRPKATRHTSEISRSRRDSGGRSDRLGRHSLDVVRLDSISIGAGLFLGFALLASTDRKVNGYLGLRELLIDTRTITSTVITEPRRAGVHRRMSTSTGSQNVDGRMSGLQLSETFRSSAVEANLRDMPFTRMSAPLH